LAYLNASALPVAGDTHCLVAERFVLDSALVPSGSSVLDGRTANSKASLFVCAYHYACSEKNYTMITDAVENAVPVY
jgi:hypothetical protein